MSLVPTGDESLRSRFRFRGVLTNATHLRYSEGTMIRYSIIAGVVLTFLLGASCATSPTTTDTRPVVVASIFPLADITRQIAGGTIRVITLLPPGVSEHTFEPTPQAVQSVAGAKLFFKIGAGLDDWTDTVALSANEQATIIDLSRSVTLQPSHEDDDAHEEETRDEHAEHGSFDPHYFLTINNAKLMATTIAQELSSAYPAQTRVFEANLKRYLAELSLADTAIKKTLTDLPTRDMVTFHGAWQYFADSYDLTIVGTFEPFPGREPSPRYLADLIADIKQKNISVLFIEPQFSAEAISQVARDLNITLATLDPIGGTTTSTQSYIDLLRTNADTIAKALKGN